MSYTALYRKWRPLVYADVVEQSYIVQTLKNAVTSDRVGHAYLFCGSRGTGKTTMAKIFSRAINCQKPEEGEPCNKCDICKGILSGRNMDVIEIDAASNNGVDNIREIRDEVVYTPAESRYKTYIIDEVHMLSAGAFNALLKTLEEPPSHAVFILATTEPHKLPSTVLSRCQRFDFRRISLTGIAARLDKIASENQCTLTPDGAKLIARLAEGGMRDAISLLDQCISSGKNPVGTPEIMDIVGLVGHDFVMEMAQAVITSNIPLLFSITDELINSGRDVKHFLTELILYFRDLLILKLTGDFESLSYPLYPEPEKINEMAQSLEQGFLMATVKELSLLESQLKWARTPRIFLEIGLIKLCERKFSDVLDTLQERISQLERKIQTGSYELTTPHVPPLSIPAPDKKTASQNDKKKNATVSMHEPSVLYRAEQSVPFWDALINETMAMGRVAVYGHLQDSSAFYASENVLVIIAAYPLNKQALSTPENLEVIRGLVTKRLGRDIHIKVEVSGAPPSEDLLTGEDPAIRKAKELAEKANIPLNIIDE